MCQPLCIIFCTCNEVPLRAGGRGAGLCSLASWLLRKCRVAGEILRAEGAPRQEIGTRRTRKTRRERTEENRHAVIPFDFLPCPRCSPCPFPPERFRAMIHGSNPCRTRTCERDGYQKGPQSRLDTGTYVKRDFSKLFMHNDLNNSPST